ncbi:MAG: TlpA family protein disulfide reductase [Chloroflexia bacterium]
MEGIWLVSYIILWLLVLGLGVLVFLLYRQLGILYLGSAEGVSRDGLAVGTAAPDFSLGDQYGNTQRLSDYRGKPTFLVFGSPSCTPCRVLLPQMDDWAAAHPEVGVLWLNAANPDESTKYASDMGATLPVVAHTPDQKLPERYHVRVTPFSFLLDQDGIIRTKGLVNSKAGLDLYYKEFKTGKRPDTEQPVAQSAN